MISNKMLNAAGTEINLSVCSTEFNNKIDLESQSGLKPNSN